MTKKNSNTDPQKRTALCYIRMQSPQPNSPNTLQKQKSNIQAVCDENGWIPEWYQDECHRKSASSIKKSPPGWQALEVRLGDDDVVALVGNDSSRFHRKDWRMGQLFDLVEQHGIDLVFAASGKHLNFSNPQDRILAQLGAIFDEWYAADISQRAKESAAYRAAKRSV